MSSAVRQTPLTEADVPAAVVPAERELMTTLRPAHCIDELIFVAQEAVRVARVQRAEITCDCDVPLRDVVIVVARTKFGDALVRIDGNIVPICAVEAE